MMNAFTNELAQEFDGRPALDEDVCYGALIARDPRFDGRFFTCVTSTGIYCRPICPARTPKREHCRFVPSAAAAEAAGFRPCLRCRPEVAPGLPAAMGTAATVVRGLRLIEEGALDTGSVGALSSRLGIGERQLRRLFLQHLGAPPLSIAANRRLGTARQLIAETDLPMTEIAHLAGYGSLRRFNQEVKDKLGASPVSLRRREKAEAEGTMETGAAVRLKLAYRPPLDWAGLLAYLGPRAIPGVEEVEGDTYRRLARHGAARALVEVRPIEGRDQLEVAMLPIEGRLPLREIAAAVRRLFDLNADPAAIAGKLASDPRLAQAFGRGPVRIPGAYDPFELAVRAVLGQQVSVKGATTLAGRVAARAGAPSPAGCALTRFFPTPSDLAAADLDGIGLTGRRIATLKAMAERVAAGDLDLSPAPTLDDAVARFTALPGIGPWTAHYVSLRALGEPDAFPAGDLGLRKALGNGAPISEKEAERASDAWRPWRGYAALALWRSLTVAEAAPKVGAEK